MNRNEMSEYIRAWRERRRKLAYEKLGGKCAKCGEVGGLEFDHIDPTTKMYSIAAIWTASKTIFESEITKCQLLCIDCHKNKTASERPPSSPPKHGELDTYIKHKCRCQPCVDRYKRYIKKRRDRLRLRKKTGEFVDTRAKLAPNDVRTIREKLADGATVASLAREYGVNNPAISRIKHGKAWKNV